MKIASPTLVFTTGNVAVAPIFLNFLTSSSGMASAPDAHRRTERRSRSSAPASNIIRNMAGTPMKGGARPRLDGFERVIGTELGQQVQRDADRRAHEQD